MLKVGKVLSRYLNKSRNCCRRKFYQNLCLKYSYVRRANFVALSHLFHFLHVTNVSFLNIRSDQNKQKRHVYVKLQKRFLCHLFVHSQQSLKIPARKYSDQKISLRCNLKIHKFVEIYPTFFMY